MTILIRLGSTFAGRQVTLANGSVDTGYKVLADGSSLGSPVERPMYSRTLDSLGVRVTGASLDAREIQLRVIVTGSTVTVLQQRLDELTRACDEITRQGGGTLWYRSSAGSYCTRYAVAQAQLQGMGEIADYEALLRQTVTVAMIVDPYGLADPLDVYDAFSTDTLGTGGLYNLGGADWTTWGTATATVSGGVLTTGSSSGFAGVLHTGTPHLHGDVQISVRASWPTSTLFVMLRYIDASNHLYAKFQQTGAGAGTMSIVATVAGAASTLATTAITTMTAGTLYYARSRIEGNAVYADWFGAVTPTPMGAATHALSAVLTTAQAAVLGSGIRSRVGLGWNVSGITIDSFAAEACTYLSRSFPTVISLGATWGGTLDAQAAVAFTFAPTGNAAAYWMLYAWWPKPAASNFVWNPGGEAGVMTAGWSVASPGGIHAAGTSIASVTAAASVRAGTRALEIVVPATVNAGANFAIYRRFEKGTTYTASCYVRSAAGTAPVGLALGTAASFASGAATAVSSSWVVRTVTWTPTADTDVAYFAVRSTTAAAMTFNIDDVVVYEGATAPAFAYGGSGPGILNAASYDTLQAATDGGFWTLAADATYRSGFRTRGTGAIGTGGALEFFLQPDLFTPDDFTSSEVDIAVFARCEVASTQASVNCVLSVAPEDGTNYGARRYGTYRSAGKALKAPSSGVAFKPYYLGTVTCLVDRANPIRWKLRIAFTNSGASTGVLGVDYLVLAPARSIASSRRGSSSAAVPRFTPSVAETTKVIRSDLSGRMYRNGAVVSSAGFPDDGLCGERIVLPAAGAELLVWPSDQVVDLTDASASSMGLLTVGSVQVAVQPQHHVLRQE